MKRMNALKFSLLGATALALVVVGTIALGGGRLFERNVALVTVFPGSVSGLQVGSPRSSRSGASRRAPR